MRGMPRMGRLVSLLALTAGLIAAAPPPGTPPRPSSPVARPERPPPIALRWTARTVDKRHTVATLTLRNDGAAPFSLRGWWIYVSAMSAIDRPIPGDGVEVAPVAGPLMRLRPVGGPAMLAPGATVTMTLRHADIMILPDKAPVGPYLVRDDDPNHGVSLTDYLVEPLPAAAQIPGAPAGIGSVVAPEDRYVANARIVPVPVDTLSPVFPTPQRMTWRDGVVAVARWAVRAPATLRAEVRFAAALNADGATGSPGQPSVPLTLAIGPVAGEVSDEAYHLTIRHDGAVITGASAAGVFRGLQSLHQIVDAAPPAAGRGRAVPLFDIIDAPRFGYRGLMLDVARNFQSRDQVLRTIDLMAAAKLNRLHLHLTDDEGWRIAIPALPELTEVGARRSQDFARGATLPPAYGSGPDADDPHGSGHYTAADYVAILTYARARHIEVIPEIEMPGHARAAVEAMATRAARWHAAGRPDADRWLLRDPGDRSTYRSAQAYTDNVIDPGAPGTYRFIETVVAQIAALHRQAGVPLRVLHIGGDELADGAWQGSPAATRAIAALPGGAGAGTAGLWDQFYDRVTAILSARGIAAAGWEELGMRKASAPGGAGPVVSEHFLNRPVTLHVWNNQGAATGLANRLANAGYPVVMSPATALYFDMARAPDRNELGHNWAGYTDLETVFRFEPFALVDRVDAGPGGPSPADSLSPAGRSRVMGIEATLFSETVRAPWRIGHMLLPRLFAVAERGWSVAPEWSALQGPAREAAYAAAWSRFATQLGLRVLPRLDRELPGFAYRIAPPGLVVRDGQVLANAELPGFVLRYTTDGSDPDRDSPVVTGPIDAKGTITVAAFSAAGRAGPSARIIRP